MKWASLFFVEAWEHWGPQRMWPGQSHEPWLLLSYLEHNSHALFHSAVPNVLLFIMSLGLSATSCINDIFISIRKKEAICQGSQTQVPLGPTQMLLISKQTWSKESWESSGLWQTGEHYPVPGGQPLLFPTWPPLLGMWPDLLFYQGSKKSRFPRDLSQVLKVYDTTHEFLKILCVAVPCKPNKMGMWAESSLQAVPPYHSDFYYTDRWSVIQKNFKPP